MGSGPRGLPSVTFRWWEAILAYLLGNVFIGGLAYGLVLGRGDASGARTVLAAVVLDLVFLGSLVVWLRRVHPGSMGAIGVRVAWRPVVAGLGLGAVLYGVAAYAVAGGLTWLLEQLSSAPVEVPSQLPADRGTEGDILAVILAVLLAPIAEELFFRGILYRSVRDPYGVLAGTAVSSVLFGVVHYTPADGASVVVLPLVMVITGIALAQIYERAGNLVVPVAAHMAFNAIGVALILSGLG